MRFAILFLVGCAQSFGEHWTALNTSAEGVFTAFTVVDGLQSRNAVDVCAESNPAIGPCGNRIPPMAYYPLTIVAHTAISMALAPKYRAWFQGVTAGIELDQVYENHALGYHVDGTWSQPGKVHP